MAVSRFEELPDDIQDKLMRFHPRDYPTFVFEPIPALEDQSIINTINSGPEGETLVRDYLQRAEGYGFF